MYYIQINYQTGDSFGNEDRETNLDINWNNLDNAKMNLKWIKEHYEMYERFNGYRSENFSEHWEEYKDKKWFVFNETYFSKKNNNVADKSDFIKNKDLYYIVSDETMSLHCMKLQADNGKLMQQWNYWCGYFERLYGAEIIIDKNNLKFNV